ncbi:hypothetical protein EPUL_005098 [Erysiphe pulchra]|uniref:J domain-containing protein n=1 Tax=Erysiphe pulchra TaxID=225359 RepID=A0A2S4PPP9_9PEZI|nr:hypothetical protein EPUL_005098 [Erysiphe pulchra]
MDDCESQIEKDKDIYQTLKFPFKGSAKRRTDEQKIHRGTSHTDERRRSRFHRTSRRIKNKQRRERDSSQRERLKEKENDNSGSYLHDSMEEGPVDPEVAFRASLFDAMRDDEGAQFWEGVYGQPVHTYPNTKPGPDGKLERMTDDEYAAYVRTKMYEKTHQYLIEEKERKDAARRQNEKMRREAAEQEREFRRNLEKSLKRGNERALRKALSEKWNDYLMRWDILEKDGPKEEIAIASIPWPVASGKRSDINSEEIERFFAHGPTGGQPSETQLKKLLKSERIRWHPDKIQQKLGGQEVNKSILQTSTFVFQVIDKLWSQIR